MALTFLEPMNRCLLRVAVVAVACGALLSGCATRSGAQRNARQPVERVVAKKSTRETDEAMERRVVAVAHFAAGISAELNDDESAAGEHYLASAAADPGHEGLVFGLARPPLQSKKGEKAI